MVKCSAYLCESVTYGNVSGLTFHRFPTDQTLRDAWVANMQIKNWKPSKTSVLCSKHFEEHYIDRSPFRTRLRPGATPTIFEILPEPFNTKENNPVTSGREQIPRKRRATGGVITLQNVQNIEPQPSTSQQQSIKKETEKEFSSFGRTTDIDSTSVVPGTCEPKCRASVEKSGLERDRLVQKLKRTIVFKNKKIKALSAKNRCLKKKVAKFGDIISDLKKKLNDEEIQILNTIPGNNKDFLVRYIKKAQKSSVDKTYSPELRSFALQLNFFSPRAYKFVRETFETALPHPGTLSRWYKKIDASPGFTSEAFVTLEKLAKNSEHPLYVNLCVDEMAIRKGLVWDSSVNKYQGFVDTGTELSDDSLPLATQALVFMVTAINGFWKIPIAYFFIHALNGEQRTNFLTMALEMLHEIKVIVCGLTFDGAASNISMATRLGCNFSLSNLTTFFIFKDFRINVFYDPCHMIKLIRNTLGDYLILLDHKGDEINFKYLEKLLKLQDSKGLHLANKLRQGHIFFSNQKMKVRLATQLLSKSVADALTCCKDTLKLPEFSQCSATIKFITIINDTFDILNSRSMFAPGYKKALCPANIERTLQHSKMCKEYLSNLKFPDNKLVVQSGRKTGFIGFIVCLESAANLFHDLIITAKLRFLPLYKISQDHLEMFFGMMRARGGFNDNPNVVQFRTAYKKNLIRSELILKTKGSIEDVPILTVSSTASILDSINNTTPSFEKNLKQLYDIDDENLQCFIANLLATPLDEYTHEVTVYISGFIARKVIKSINCATCQILVLGDKQNFFYSLIKIKDRGGLVYPADRVISIIQKCEKIFKINQYVSLNEIIKFIWESENYMHLFNSNDIEHDANHIYLLIKVIAKFYIELRCKHHAKGITTNMSKRNYLKKVVLFQNI